MHLLTKGLNPIKMSATANDKIRFANLKWEQLLAEKYFVDSCFTKKNDSYSSHQELTDLMFKIKCK